MSNQELLNLQKSFTEGYILENNIPEDIKKQLKELFEAQNAILKDQLLIELNDLKEYVEIGD